MRTHKFAYYLPAFSLFVFLVLAGSLPGLAAADTSPSVSVQQLTPQNAPPCVAPTILSVTPYIYSGSMDSFDVVISDSSYVAIGGNAGNVTVPLQFISRWGEQGGAVRLHVDIDAVPVVGTVPVSLTMLSAETGKGICAATVSFTVQGAASAAATPIKAPSAAPVKSQQPGAGTTTASSSVSSTTPVVSVVVSASVLANPFSNLSVHFPPVLDQSGILRTVADTTRHLLRIRNCCSICRCSVH